MLTRKFLEREGLINRIETVDGNYETDPLGSGFDVVFLSAIIHSNSADVNQLLFTKANDALNAEGRTVVLDHVMRKDRTTPLGGAFFSLNMLVGTKAGDTVHRSRDTAVDDRSWFRKHPSKEHSIRNGLNDWEEENIVVRISPLSLCTILPDTKKEYSTTEESTYGNQKCILTPMSGKRVIITGPTSGFGKEIALQLAAKGAEIVLACRDSAR